MKLNSGREKVLFPITCGRARIILLATVLLGFIPAGRDAASAGTLTGLARAVASDNAAGAQVPAVSRGYSSLGLRREAAAYLERAIHLGEITPGKAAPLFEEIAREQSRWDDPAGLVAICETGIRSGVRTDFLMYSYGTGLRQSGMIADASAVFTRIPKESIYHPYALFSIAQIAAEEGRDQSAREEFERVREIVRERKDLEFLRERVVRAQAGHLLSLGRPDLSGPLFQSLLREGKDPMVAVGSAANDNGARSDDGDRSWDTAAGWPAKKQILLLLLRGGLSRERGEFEAAVSHLTRAEAKIQSALASQAAPPSETFGPFEPVEILRRQVERHRSLRRLLASPDPSMAQAAAKEGIVELLVELLFIDHSITKAERSMPKVPAGSAVAYLSRDQVEEIIRTIERVILEGVDVDGLVESLARKLDVFQNLAHPIERYRLLTKLEKSQDEIHRIKQRIHERREAAIKGIEAGFGAVPVSRLLEEMGRFLLELDAIRDAAGGLRRFTRRNFNILRERDKMEELPREANGGLADEALAIDRIRFDPLLPSVKMLEENARRVSWERSRQEIASIRPVVARQMVDALIGRARVLRARETPEGQQEAWAFLRRAVSYIERDSLSPRDRAEASLQVGSFLEEREGRWELFPGRTAGVKEKEAIASVLPVLEPASRSGEWQEEAAYLLVSLRTMMNDPGARPAAAEYLRRFPSSPFAGRIAMRMGHEALQAGRLSDARSLYRRAAESPESATADDARYMLGWIRFQGGDASGAAGELSRQLTDPAYRCVDPSPFERSVLDLAVRVWRESPLEGLRSYPPVREGTCGGRRLLLSLGNDEERRGETARSATVYGLLAERFGFDNEAILYEKKAVSSLLRAGMEDQAFSRVLQLGEKYGPGTEWAESRSPEMRIQARKEMAALLRSISEKKFDEGVRSGERKAMVDAKTGMERFFASQGKAGDGEDAELRLKWAIASLKAGDRETGIAILKGLAERGEAPVGERAAILYAETRIAAYERKEDTAEGAEEAARLLLDGYPSEKAAALAYRAAADFLAAKEYGRARRLALAIESNRATPKPVLADARLVSAESEIFLNEPSSAREKAERVLSSPSGEVTPEVRERAKNLFVLASLKKVESMTSAGDWTGAAGILEELGNRFPDDGEAPQYLLRAFRSYRMGGDPEAAVRMGILFLEQYPKRKEGVEIAGAAGTYLLDRGETRKAADLYARVAERFPKSAESPDLLFLAARLTGESGDPKETAKRFSAYRARYENPKWKTVYATLSIGMISWKGGDAKAAIRELEEGIRQVDAGPGKDAPRDLWELAGEARIVLGEYWAEQFRKLRLVAPLEKNLAIKERFFKRSLAMFEKAKEESPTEIAINASQMSGDLFVDFGKSILASQRPKGLREDERSALEDALKRRARSFFEKGLDWYVGALDRLEAEEGPADLAVPIRERIENVQRLLSEETAPGGGT